MMPWSIQLSLTEQIGIWKGLKKREIQGQKGKWTKMRACLLPPPRIWIHAITSLKKGKKLKTILKLEDWFENNSATLRNEIHFPTSTLLK